MADPIPTIQPVPDTTSSTVTIVENDTQDSTERTLHLKLKKPKNRKKVKWTTETVDNEDMNKKKSKCCCIYVKPKKIGDSSSSSEDSDDEECDHCKGHIEKKKKHTDHSHTEGDHQNHIDGGNHVDGGEPSTSS